MTVPDFGFLNLVPFGTMTYYQQLHPWCIVRLLPRMQRQIVARFRRRNPAEAHLQALRQLEPAANYEIVFDPALQPAETQHERTQS